MIKLKCFFIFLISLFVISPVFADDGLVLPSMRGKVISVSYEDSQEGITNTKQVAKIKILNGELKNQVVNIENMMSGNPYYDIVLKKNMNVILHAEEVNNSIVLSVADVERSNVLIVLSVLFCGLLLYVGKKKGLFSLISIAITVVLIICALSPMILAGISPVIGGIIVCVLSTAVTMYLVGGFNAKSTSAVIGAILSLGFAAILSYLTIFMAHITGFTGENMVFLYSAHPELDFVSITVSMMILATLGAVMDVAMSISSTINEIYLTDNKKTVSELFISGMNVGRDIIGTMANTLILVYLGGAIPLILLSSNIDLQKFMNLNQVVTETASALIGSIAIVICVPFTAAVASVLIHKYANISKYDNIKID